MSDISNTGSSAPSPIVGEATPEQLENLRRDFLNASFWLLKGLSMHDIKNVALQKPLEAFMRAYESLRPYSKDSGKVEIRYQDNVIQINHTKVLQHFTIVEALKFMTDSLETAMFESICFSADLSADTIGGFFSKWALHNSVNSKPKAFSQNIEGIEFTLQDPEKSNLRLKSRQLLLSPLYALKHYSLLKNHAADFLRALTKNSELISQRRIRRELVELAEILKVSPYQIAALSLIRDEGDGGDPAFHAAVNQSVATCLLSMALAKELQFSIRDQINLGMVGLMYNVGLLGEVSETVNKKDALTPVEYKRILDAQASGVYKLIQVQGSSRPVLERLLAIFEYSKGANAKSVSLNLDARILRLVSQYVALTSERPFRDAYTPAEAVRLLGSKAASNVQGAELDPLLYYLFVRFLGVIPMGSLCLLSSGERGILFRPSGEKLGTPLIKILSVDPKVRARLVDLANEPNLKVSKILDPKREGVNVAHYFFE